MHIASLKLRNWECFRGEHEIVLDATTYAIVARRRDDPHHSNFGGKSSLLRAVDFALHGRLGAIHRAVDGWISEGEKQGEVTLVLSDGSRIVRSRAGAAATKVWWYPAGAPAAIAMGDEADAAIEIATGLSAADFRASCYFEQGAMSRLVTMKPQERMEIVSAWFRMEALQRAESIERNSVSELVSKADAVARAEALQRELRARALAGVNCAGLEEARADLASAAADLAAAQQALAGVQARVEANEARLAVADARTRLEALTVEGKALAAEVEAGDQPVLTEHDVETLGERAARLTHDAARLAEEAKRVDAALVQKRRLAAGQFDGRCPIAPVECPARGKINAMRDEHQKAVSLLMQQSADADQAAAHAREEADGARADEQEQERKRARLESMRESAARLTDQIEAADPLPAVPREQLRVEYEGAQSEVVELRNEHAALVRAIAEVEKADTEIAQLTDQRTAIATELEAARASLAVLGKQGVQRRLAEGALVDIEARARDMLAAASIPIDLAVKWAREGAGLAAACDACGMAYPTSARVKACTRCGAARGANIVNKLEVELSNRSGAADDLAGAALQLAASAWLREDRGAAWSVAMLDEPFGALDRSLRRAFASHLAAFLSTRYGIEQAFVISHTPDTVEQLPGRIEVVNDGKWSSVSVVG